MGVMKRFTRCGLTTLLKLWVNIERLRRPLVKTLRHQAVFGKQLAIGTKIGPVQGEGTDALILKAGSKKTGQSKLISQRQ